MTDCTHEKTYGQRNQACFAPESKLNTVPKKEMSTEDDVRKPNFLAELLIKLACAQLGIGESLITSKGLNHLLNTVISRSLHSQRISSRLQRL